MHFLTKWHEILSPPYACAEVGIIGIELKPNVMSQTIEHGIDHVVHLDKETAVDANTAYHPSTKGFINLPIGYYI
jgi:hypothetical protein